MGLRRRCRQPRARRAALPGPLRVPDLLPLLPALGVAWLVNTTAVLALLSVLSAGGLSWRSLTGGGLRGLWRGPGARCGTPPA